MPNKNSEIEIVPEAEWVARNFILDRPDKLRLSVSLGDRDGGFSGPIWCWFVYDLKQNCSRLAYGTAVTLGEAQAAAVEWADRQP